MSKQVGLIHSLKDGQSYMEIWPARKELNAIFPEQRIIKATRFGIKVMPAVAAISVLTQMAFNNYDALPQAIVVALFAISMPLQGMWWLAVVPTPNCPCISLLVSRIASKITETGFALEPVKARPRYKELAVILNRAFRQLDKTALERWF